MTCLTVSNREISLSNLLVSLMHTFLTRFLSFHIKVCIILNIVTIYGGSQLFLHLKFFSSSEVCYLFFSFIQNVNGSHFLSYLVASFSGCWF